MANPVKGVTRLRPEPYDPDAQDGDGDGIVQERTAWERPAGTRLLDRNGDPIARGRSLTERPAGLQVVDKDGRKVNYRPSYSPDTDTPASAGGQGGTRTPLSDLGARSLAEMGLPTLRSMNQPPAPQQSPIEPSKTPDPAPPSVKLPDPPKKPRNPSLAPFDGRAQELADQAGGDWTKFAELLNREGYVAFDYETTGFDDGNIPVQVGAVRVKDGKIVERLNLFMNPRRGLSQWSKDNLLDANGQPLTDEWLAGQQSIEDAHRQLLDFLGDSILVAQYIPFDEEVLTRTLKGLGIDYEIKGKIDTKELGAQILPKGDGTTGPLGHSLKDLSDFLGVRLDNWHTADADSAAAARVLMGTLQAARDRNANPNILDGEWQKARYAERVAQHKADMEEFRKKKEQYDRLVAQGYDLAPTERIVSDDTSTGTPPSTTGKQRGLSNPRARATRGKDRFATDEADTPEAREATKSRVAEIATTVQSELEEIRMIIAQDEMLEYTGGDNMLLEEGDDLVLVETERGKRFTDGIIEAGSLIRADVARRFGKEITELQEKSDAAIVAHEEALGRWQKVEASGTSMHQAAIESLYLTDLPEVPSELLEIDDMADGYDGIVSRASSEHTAALHELLDEIGLVEDGKVRIFVSGDPRQRGTAHIKGQFDPEVAFEEAGDAAWVVDVPLDDIVASANGSEVHFRAPGVSNPRSVTQERAALPLASLEKAADEAAQTRQAATAARDDARRRVASAYRQVLSEIRPFGAKTDLDLPIFDVSEYGALPDLTGSSLQADQQTAREVMDDIRAGWPFFPSDWTAPMSEVPIAVQIGERGGFKQLFRDGEDGALRPFIRGIDRIDERAPEVVAIRTRPPSQVDMEENPRLGQFDRSSIVHELTHFAQAIVPEIRLAENAFLYRRNGGEESVPINGKFNETGYPDEFFNGYVGRVYEDSINGVTEVMPMAMQSIFAPRAHYYGDLIDDEYLDWTIGVLATIGKSR